MAGIKVWLVSLVFQLCCSMQSIFASDEALSKLQRRMELLEKQNVERSAVNLRQQQMIDEQARQLERTNDLVAKLRDLVVGQASEIEEQRNKIEDLNQSLRKISSNTELTERAKALALITFKQSLANAENSKVENTTDRIPNTNFRPSVNTDMPNSETKSSKEYISSSDTAQRTNRFVLNREGPFAFHAVSDKHEISHISGGQSIIFENVLLNIGGALLANHALFIAEMPGVYLFSVSILSFVNSRSEYTAALVKNGGNLALVYGHGDSGRHDQGSVTVVTQLNAGDEVWVKLLSPPDASIYGGRYTTFSGVLLHSL